MPVVPLTKGSQLGKILDNKLTKKQLRKKCEDLWRKIVIKKAGYKCEYPACNNSERLNAHHIYTKGGHEKLRFDPENGMALCYYHHKGARDGAHNDPEFKNIIIAAGVRTEKLYGKLKLKARVHTKQKIDLNLEMMYLQQEWEKLN